MSVTVHQRPGVYSAYDASSLVSGRSAGGVVGLAGVNTKAQAGMVHLVTRYEQAVTIFGDDGEEGMAELIRLALKNGASAVAAVAVANESGYQAAFDALAAVENIAVVICGSTSQSVQQALRDSVAQASAARMERIAVVAGGVEEGVSALVARAKADGCHFIKIMVSGIMEFDRFGGLTDTPCSPEMTRDMIAIAHDAGFAVMAHANGVEAVSRALSAGVDSIEHGAYLDRDTIHQLAETGAVWVPTLAAYGNLRGLGRFPDEALNPLTALQQENVAYAASIGAKIACGSDAGAYAVPHSTGAEDEARLLREALGDRTDAVLTEGERVIREKF